jgi:hypothetical protein
MKKILGFTAVFILVFLVVSGAHADLNNGLIAYYPFSGDANDASGNGFNGTIVGPILSSDQYDNPNSTYQFNGSNDYIDTIPAHLIPSSISFSVWIYPTRLLENEMQIFGSMENASGGKNGINGSYGNSGGNGNLIKFSCYQNNLLVGPTVTIPTTALPLNSWSHVVFILNDANEASIYVDGDVVGSGNFSTACDTHDRTLMIGKSVRSQSRSFEGKIDEVRIYNRALTTAEVQQIYNEEKLEEEEDDY